MRGACFDKRLRRPDRIFACSEEKITNPKKSYIYRPNDTSMLHTVLAGLYERDLQKLIEEVSLFRSEDDLWKTTGAIKNTAGNLALHLIGSFNYFFGTQLANTGYVRNRDQEFAQKDVPRQELIQQLERLIPLVKGTLNSLTDTGLEKPFPIPFDGGGQSCTYVLVRLLAHLSYHLGQINYLRRALEP
jgi:Protein of unknown function (DUF1572)